MSNRFRGKRGSQGEGWTWDDDPAESEGLPRPRAGFSLLVPILAVLVLAALAGVGVFIAAGGGDDDSGVVAPPTESTRTTAKETPAPSAQPTSVSSPSDPTQPSFTFVAWSRSEKRWQTGDIENTDYREGEAIPIMIRIDDSKPGTVYDLKLRYDCASGSVNVFDFLAGAAAEDTIAFTVAPGPELPRPDTTPTMPDDPSIPYDDGAVRLFRVWGGIFHQPPVGPLPATGCEGEKRLSLTVLARDDAVFLIIAAHLSSAANWGEDKGASSATDTLTLEGAVDDAPAQTITIATGTVRR